jgi:hypothetical protein
VQPRELLNLAGPILVLVFSITAVWEFVLEGAVLKYLGLDRRDEATSEQWNHHRNRSAHPTINRQRPILISP